MKNIVSTLEQILKINSPTGFTHEVISFIENIFRDSKLFIKKTNKGSLLISLHEAPELILTAHIDTLGAMVKEINEDGTLSISRLGGLTLTSFEGEYVTVRNSGGNLFRGTFLLNNPAAHVNKEVESAKRTTGNMSIRLDELVRSDAGTAGLGINVGDFIFYDTRFEYTSSGFIKAVFLTIKPVLQ
jgi:putative aminopeptidase FrvX